MHVSRIVRVSKWGLLLILLASCGTHGSADPKADGGRENTHPETDAPILPEFISTPEAIEINAEPFVLAPGAESVQCYFVSLPTTSALRVNRLESLLGVGGHHMILYTSSVRNQPDGTAVTCNTQLGGGTTPNDLPTPIFLAQEPIAAIEMPPDTALEFEPGQPFMVELHYVNTSPRPLVASFRIKARLAPDATTLAGFFSSYNFQINVPPHGTQTVSGHCAVPAGVNFFRMTTHAHSRMTSALVARWHGGQVGETLVQSADWENPTVSDWAPPYLRFAADEELYYSCSYRNDGPTTIVEGTSVAENEMCMAIGYYFPALSATVCVDSFAFPR